MLEPHPDRVTWLDRFVPRAIGSASAQWLNAAAGSIGAAFVINTVDNPPSIIELVLLVVFTQGVTALVIGCGSYVGRNNSTVRFAGVVSAGIIRGLILWVIVSRLGGEVPLEVGLEQLLVSVVFTSLWLISAGHVIQGTRDYRATFGARFEKAVSDGLRDSDSSATWIEANQLAEKEQALARARIESVSHHLDHDLDEEIARDMVTIAEEIHEAAMGRIRPVSHQIWKRTTFRPPTLRVRVIMYRSLVTWQTPLGLAVFIAGTVTGFGAVVGRGFFIGLFTGTVVAVIAYLLLLLRRLLQQQLSSPQISPAASLLAIGPVTFLALEFIGRGISLPPDMGGALVVSIASFVLCFVVTALSGIRQHQSALLQEMDHLLATGHWQELVGQAVESRHASDAATYLHHKVQSQLLAVALQLEMAAAEEDHAKLVETLSTVRTVLNEPIEPKRRRVSSYDSVMSIAAEWDGICAIEMNTPIKGELPENTWRVLDLMLRELVANAVRSGKANVICIDIRQPSTQEIEVSVHDNGVGLTQVTPGLGTAWMNIVAQNILVSASPLGGSTFTLHIPVIN